MLRDSDPGKHARAHPTGAKPLLRWHLQEQRRSEEPPCLNLLLDRGDLPYLNALEKFNCFYCGYANGLMGYGREVAARTEQFFCPIKHARRIRAAHDRYPGFFEYGDADSYRLGLERLRDNLARCCDDS